MKKLMLSIAMAMGLSVANSQIKFSSPYWIYSPSNSDTIEGDWQRTICYFACDTKKNELRVETPNFEANYKIIKKDYSSKRTLENGKIEKMA